MTSLVDIAGLDFAYGRQQVLSGIDLRVDAGTTLGLIGPNGGGKTTLIRLLLGVIQPTAGSIRVAGVAPSAAIKRGDLIGYLPQKLPLSSRLPLSVRQVVRLGLAGKTGVFRTYDPDDLAFADSLLDRVGIAEMAERPVGGLSGGELQRVYIARALAPRPQLLLLDEPTTGIDRRGQHRFIDFIADLKASLGLTIVFVSHDLRAVSSISDRIACLNRTLHYHDVPDHLPAELVYSMFACDLEAMGIKGGSICTHEHAVGCPGHDHTHEPVAKTPAATEAVS